jgi:hypothetical protein
MRQGIVLWLGPYHLLVDHFAIVTCDQCLNGSVGHIELEPPDTAITERGQEATTLAGEASFGRLGVEFQVLRLGPHDGGRRRRTDEQERVARTVPNIAKGDLLIARKERTFAGKGDVASSAGCGGEGRRTQHGRHPWDEPLVVRAVPRLIEMELFVETHLLEVGQQLHAPAQQRLMSAAPIVSA